MLCVVFAAGWNEKCGSWMSDPFNDYCYLFNYLSMRTWAEARADCVNQGGDLVSITDPFEQAFVHGTTFTSLLHCSGCNVQCYEKKNKSWNTSGIKSSF